MSWKELSTDFCLTNVSSYWWKEKLEEIKKCIIILLSLDHCTVWDFWFYDALRENVKSFKVGIFCTYCKILYLNLKLIKGFLIYINGRFHWDHFLKVSKLKVQNPKSKIHIFLTFAFFDNSSYKRYTFSTNVEYLCEFRILKLEIFRDQFPWFV